MAEQWWVVFEKSVDASVSVRWCYKDRVLGDISIRLVTRSWRELRELYSGAPLRLWLLTTRVSIIQQQVLSHPHDDRLRVNLCFLVQCCVCLLKRCGNSPSPTPPIFLLRSNLPIKAPTIKDLLSSSLRAHKVKQLNGCGRSLPLLSACRVKGFFPPTQLLHIFFPSFSAKSWTEKEMLFADNHMHLEKCDGISSATALFLITCSSSRCYKIMRSAV